MNEISSLSCRGSEFESVVSASVTLSQVSSFSTSVAVDICTAHRSGGKYLQLQADDIRIFVFLYP